MADWGYILEAATGKILQSISASSRAVEEARKDPTKTVVSSFTEVKHYQESKRKG